MTEQNVVKLYSNRNKPIWKVGGGETKEKLLEPRRIERQYPAI